MSLEQCPLRRPSAVESDQNPSKHEGDGIEQLQDIHQEIPVKSFNREYEQPKVCICAISRGMEAHHLQAIAEEAEFLSATGRLASCSAAVRDGFTSVSHAISD